MPPRLSQVTTASAEAMSIKYNTMVYELRRAGVEVIVMSLGEAFFDLPLFPMDDLPLPASFHYSHSRGIPELRDRLAAYFGERYDVPVDPERELLVTAGSKAAIHMALMAILDPGDEVILHEPTWVSYTEQVKLCYGVPVHVPWDVPLSGLEAYVTPRTRAIVITNPHNPRGYVMTEAEVAGLLDLARRRDLWLLSDEVYSDFVLDPASFVSVGRLDRAKDHAVVFNSISKNYGISGWRMGYVVANEALIYNILKVNQHLITCPPTLLEHYIAAHFTEILEITHPQIRKVLHKRAQLAATMDELGLVALPGDATFYFFVSIAPSRLGSEAFCTRLLQEHHVSTVPGVGYGRSCDRFIRVSVGTATMEQNRHGLRRIRRLIDETS